MIENEGVGDFVSGHKLGRRLPAAAVELVAVSLLQLKIFKNIGSDLPMGRAGSERQVEKYERQIY